MFPRAILLVVAAVCAPLVARAADVGLPPASIKIIVPGAAGGALDLSARVLAGAVGQTGGPTVVVEDKPGAGSIVGSGFVARSRPDGATVLISGMLLFIAPNLRSVGYDPVADFEPICATTDTALAIVVRADSPYRTLDDLVVAARVNPGGVAFGAFGPGTPHQLIAALLRKFTGARMNVVPYGGEPGSIAALAAGQVDAIVAVPIGVRGQIAAGEFRALAVTAGSRVKTLPLTPTALEAGYPIEFTGWNGLWAPAKTPPSVVAALAAMFSKAIGAPAFAAAAEQLGASAVDRCGPAFGDWVTSQQAMIAQIIHDSGMKME